MLYQWVTQERKFNFIKIFFHLNINGGTEELQKV